MATREEYNQCMRPHITGTGKTKEQRKLDFCIGAKICSGKAKTEEEAKKVCLLPKEPKETKCPVEQIVSCLIKNTDFSPKNVLESLKKSIPICVCGEKPKRTKTQEKRGFLTQFGFGEKDDNGNQK